MAPWVPWYDHALASGIWKLSLEETLVGSTSSPVLYSTSNRTSHRRVSSIHHPGAGQGVLGGDRPQGALKPLERTLMIQRQQSADRGIIVSPPSDTSETAGMMQRAVHFPPPGNTASWPTTGARGCAPTARSASAATRHGVDPQPPRPR